MVLNFEALWTVPARGFFSPPFVTGLFCGTQRADDLARLHDAGQLPIRVDFAIDARSVFDGVTAAEVRLPLDVNLHMRARMLREWLDRGVISFLWWVDTRDMISDALTKGGVPRGAVVKVMTEAKWYLEHAAVKWPQQREQGAWLISASDGPRQ